MSERIAHEFIMLPPPEMGFRLGEASHIAHGISDAFNIPFRAALCVAVQDRRTLVRIVEDVP